jgi:hypothetical protein
MHLRVFSSAPRCCCTAAACCSKSVSLCWC